MAMKMRTVREPGAEPGAAWAGYVYAAGVVVIWAGFSLLSRFSARNVTGTGLTPWDLGALRFGVAFVAAAGLWAAGIGRGVPPRRGLAMALLGAGFALPAYLGFRFAPAAHGALIMSGTLPFLVAAASWPVLRERWSRGKLVSLGLLLAGLLLVAAEGYWHGHAPPGAWRGDLLFLLAGSSWAVFTVLTRLWRPRPGQAVVSVGLWCGALFLPLWWLALPSHLGQAAAGEVAVQAVFQGVVAVLLSLWLFTRALERLGPERLTAVTALVPGIAALAAVPLLGEGLGLLTVVGLAAVCGAVILGIGRGAA